MFNLYDWKKAPFCFGGDGGGSGGGGGGDGQGVGPDTASDAIGQASQGDTGATGAGPSGAGVGSPGDGPVGVPSVEVGMVPGAVSNAPTDIGINVADVADAIGQAAQGNVNAMGNNEGVGMPGVDQGGMPGSMTQEGIADDAAVNENAAAHAARMGMVGRMANGVFGLVAPTPIGMINSLSGMVGGPTVGSVAMGMMGGPGAPGTATGAPSAAPAGTASGGFSPDPNAAPSIGGGDALPFMPGGLLAQQPAPVAAPPAAIPAGILNPNFVYQNNSWDGNRFVIPGLLRA